MNRHRALGCYLSMISSENAVRFSGSCFSVAQPVYSLSEAAEMVGCAELIALRHREAGAGLKRSGRA